MELVKVLLAFGLCVPYVSTESYTDPASCAKPNTISTGAGVTVPRPPVPALPPTFQTMVEANLVDEGRTITAEEYYDDPNNRAVVKLIQNDHQDFILLDYTANQIVYIDNGVCTVKDLEMDDNQLLFGLQNGPADMPHIYTTNGALHFAQSNGLLYLGQSTIRGITVDHWQSCMYWDILQSNFTLDYYFTAITWQDPVLFSSVPVRAEIQGLQMIGNVSRTFHHIYEYFDFRTHIWDGSSVFQIPDGIACPGLLESNFTYPPGCAAPNTVQSISGPAPPLPRLPDAFQTKLEINIIDKQTSFYTSEYYDRPNNRAVMYIIQNNEPYRIYMDYTNDQILTVIDGTCTVTTLEQNMDEIIFGLKYGPGGIPHMYSTSGALRFATANGLTYMGRDVIRGINVDHWQSCMYWDIVSSNFTLDYFFTAASWTDSILQPQVPVRAEVIGYMAGILSRKFHHIYDYYDFRYGIWGDHTLYETPSGIICPGRKQLKTIPQLSGQYSYKEEIVSTLGNQVSQADIWYDYSYKLVRFDYRPQFSAYPYYTTDAVTEIHDYSSGVAYAIDKTLGNCTILPIQNASFGSSLNISRGGADNNKEFVVRMKSPSQMWYLDNTTYTYEGQRMARDMLCDVFISNRTDFNLPGYQTFYSIFEFYFLADSWESSNNVGRLNKMNSDIPIRLDITAESWVGYQASYNFYNFVEEDPSYNVFDVTSCYDDDSKIPFYIEFDDAFDVDTLKHYKKEFLQASIETLIPVTGYLARIRIQNIDFQMYYNAAYIFGSLLEAPPALSFFQRIPGVYKQYSNDKYVTVSDVYECASSCNNGDVTPCNSFEYCPGANLCSLSKSHANEGTIITSTAGCDFYAKTVRSTQMEIPIDQAWESLTNVVIAGYFKIHVNIDGKNIEYTATSLDQDVILNGERLLSTQTAIQSFEAQLNKGIPGYDDLVLTGIAIDACAEACLGQEEWVCNSFEYCFDTGYCVLSRLHPDEEPEIIVNMLVCDLYSKKYTVNYEMIEGQTVLSSSDVIYQDVYSADMCAKLCSNYQGFDYICFRRFRSGLNSMKKYTVNYEMIEGQTVLSSSDVIYQDVYSADMCAKLCSNYQGFDYDCKSFDYCDYLSTCYLGKTHYYDVPKADIQLTPSCTHYSRNYLYDFKKTGRKTIANRDDRIISGISVTECAKLCVEEESFMCASFDYCGNVTECRLSTASMKNIGQISVTANLYCDIYSRQTFPDGTPFINNPEKYFQLSTPPTTVSNMGGYSKGAMTGLGIGMAVIGIILAMVIFMVVGKVRSKPVDTKHVPISFENKEFSDAVDS